MAKRVILSTRVGLGWSAGDNPIPGATRAIELQTESGLGWSVRPAPINPSAPVNVLAPSISGDIRQGELVTASRGNWSSSGTVTYAYRWLAGGVAISGATGLTYTPKASDVSKGLSFEVTATNASGSTVRATTAQSVLPEYVASVAFGDIIGAFGNSTVAGFATGGGTAQVANSWPTKLAQLMTTAGVRSSAQNRFGCASGSFATLLQMDGRVTSSGGFTQSASFVPGGNAMSTTAAGSSVTINLGVSDKIVVYWINNTAGRIANYSVSNGGPSGTITTTGTYALQKLELDAPLGEHSITISNNTAAVVIMGVEAYDSTGGIPTRVYNFGISGGTSTQLIDNSDATAGRRAGYLLLAPKICIIEGCIINDWRSTLPITVAQSKANLNTLIDTVLQIPGAVPILMTPVFDNGVGGNTADQELYVTAMREIAAERGIKLIDIRALFVSWEYANAQGWMSDTVHPSAIGYQVIAEYVLSVLRLA